MPTLNNKSPKRPWIQERKPFERMANKNQDIYNGTRWRKLSKYKKQIDPICEICEKEAVYCVDHKRPINEGGAIYDLDNLQSLCVGCNASKTGKQKNKKQWGVRY